MMDNQTQMSTQVGITNTNVQILTKRVVKLEQERDRFLGQAQANPQALPKPRTQVNEITYDVGLHTV